MPAASWVAVDLDRTVVFSRSLAGTTANLRCVEHLSGREQSFLTDNAEKSLRELGLRVPVVPATTRTPSQYARIRLPWAPVRYAVTLNGAEILEDGRPDDGWRARVTADVRAECAPVGEILQPIEGWGSRTWLDNVRDADGVFVYLVIRPDVFPSEVVRLWSRHCAPLGWSVSQQGRKVYAMPNPVTKTRAVGEIRERLVAEGQIFADAALIAAGDGALDRGLLELADHAIRPAHGELHDSKWRTDGLVITSATGAEAGEEIARWLLALASPASTPL